MLENVCISEGISCVYKLSCSQFTIFGKNLKSFSYSGEFENYFCIFDAPSPDKTTFEVRGIEDIESDGRMRIAAYSGFKLFMGLANVKSLKVSPASLQLLACAEELVAHLSPLYNLNHLVVKDNDEPGDFACRGLMNVLQNSPHLESLHFVKATCLNYQAIASFYISILVDGKLCCILCPGKMIGLWIQCLHVLEPPEESQVSVFSDLAL
ncbi:hypothetical protein CRYUN_Cryun37aG0121900 [Craigia yunnanensis]